MTTMKLVADENIPFVKQAFAHLGDVITRSGRQIGNKNLTDADVLLVRSVTQVNQELLENTSVKFVATATSFNNHIDTEYLKSKNIGFASALGSNAISVAQYVISAICYWSLQEQRPLDELTLGILGYGNVGRRLKQICDRLNIKTVINDPPLEETTNSSDVDFYSIEKALACDVVSLHVPYIIDGKHPTKDLINSESLKQLKPDSLFINSSRGEVVNELELLEFSEQNNISLVLDVWQNEPNISLKSLSKTLIATPHIAGYSYDGKIRGTEMIEKSCCEYFNVTSQWPKNEVDFGDHKAVEIDLSQTLDIRKEILKAYTISVDDGQLKKALDNQQACLAHYFDRLRKSYLIRREWSFK